MTTPGYDVCAGCGVYIGTRYGNHHCDAKLEKRIEAARKGVPQGVEWRPTEACRLEYGFSLLNMAYQGV